MTKKKSKGKTTYITASKFKACCLGIMDEVAETAAEYVITKRERPVARLVRCTELPKGSVYGMGRDLVEITGDIVAPVVPAEDWAVLADGEAEPYINSDSGTQTRCETCGCEDCCCIECCQKCGCKDCRC